MAMPTTDGDATTTIDSLKDDNIDDILLRLPSRASVARAVLASERWSRVASRPDFLRRFRARHPASSSHLLGIFATEENCSRPSGLPSFHLAGSVRSDPDLAAVAHRGDFLLAHLEDDPEWRLLDCYNGRLLLSRDGTSLSIYDPISLRRITVRRPDNDAPDRYVTDCLLRGGGSYGAPSSTSFRVVSLQNRHAQVRAVEYDSSTMEWRFHPWSRFYGRLHNNQLASHRAMHAAAGLIFWRYHNHVLLRLNTTTMEFSLLALPERTLMGVGGSSYAAGQTGDGACCLACVDADNGMFQVWLLREDDKWELEKEMAVEEVVPEPYHRRCKVRAVAAGVALVRGSVGTVSRHFAIDLEDLSIKAKFLCGEFAYPFHLPWPSAWVGL